jgi:3-phosphoshikimate 1-carboxyvinyltransferase
LAPLDLTIPGDFSSAAYWVALALLGGAGPGVVMEGVGLNPGRTGFLRALAAMGADTDVRQTGSEAGEPLGELAVRRSRLRALELPPEWIPTLLDEIPVLACLAVRASGTTSIRDAAELRVKESDRIARLCQNLAALGVHVREFPDGLEIEGTRARLSGSILTGGDHRIAMAFAILGATPGCALEIDDRECAAVSYPNFWAELERISEASR